METNTDSFSGLTKGDRAVRLTHLPSGEEQQELITDIKKRGAALIDLLESYRPAPNSEQAYPQHHGEKNRLLSMAQTDIERGIRDAVAALTLP